MNERHRLIKPENHAAIEDKCRAINFSMPSDLMIGSLLRTLITSRPGGNFLELGTGVGLSLSWMVDGMDANGRLTTVDNDPVMTGIATDFFGRDPRVHIVLADGGAWIRQYRGEGFDLIFADAWPGKYSETTETLALLKPGGFYVIDDMVAQPNWPPGHDEKVAELLDFLEGRPEITLTKMNWSTGVVVASRRII